jgi:predicted dehydrogenase
MIADPDIDIVDCGTRPIVRHPMVLAALRHGKHVYNGIPCATDLETARALYDAWKKSSVVAVVDAYSEWLPAHRVAKQMIDEGFLGKPFGGRCIFNLSLFNQPHPQFPYNWFAQDGQGVSAVRNLGSHALHMLVHLFGDVEELVAHDDQLLSEWHCTDSSIIDVRTNDFANMILRFASGMVIQFQVSWNAPLGPGWQLEAFGSKGRLVASDPSFPTALGTSLYAGTLDRKVMERVEIPESFLKSSDVEIDATMGIPPSYPMALSMNAMIRAIEGKAQARPDFEQAWTVERIQGAIRRSSAERRWVKLAEIV